MKTSLQLNVMLKNGLVDLCKKEISIKSLHLQSFTPSYREVLLHIWWYGPITEFDIWYNTHLLNNLMLFHFVI